MQIEKFLFMFIKYAMRVGGNIAEKKSVSQNSFDYILDHLFSEKNKRQTL